MLNFVISEYVTIWQKYDPFELVLFDPVKDYSDQNTALKRGWITMVEGRMLYRRYKTSFSDCETVPGSYDPKSKRRKRSIPRKNGRAC